MSSSDRAFSFDILIYVMIPKLTLDIESIEKNWKDKDNREWITFGIHKLA